MYLYMIYNHNIYIIYNIYIYAIMTKYVLNVYYVYIYYMYTNGASLKKMGLNMPFQGVPQLVFPSIIPTAHTFGDFTANTP